MNEKWIDRKTATLLSFLIVILGVSYAFIDRQETLQDGLRLVDPATFVEQFGQQLKFVSLTGDPGIVKDEMETYYRGYVSEGLLAEWEKNPSNAPGRLTSSPSPESIEVSNVKQIDMDKYKIEGDVVEKTNDQSGSRILRPFVLELSFSERGYQITDFKFGSYQ